jgi:hypothetical protein
VTSREREAALAATLLVQACEESDPEGRFVPFREREAAWVASRGPQDDAPTDAARVARRAKPLADALCARHATLRTAHRAALLRIPVPAVVAAAGLAGLAADALGARKTLSILAFPLGTLLAWNLAVYLVGGVVGPFLAKLPPQRPRLPQRVGLWLAERSARLAPPEAAQWIAASLRRFAGAIPHALGPLFEARTRAAFHLGAIAFAAGIVAGMYVRGLVLEYRATWESTFVESPASVAAFLGTALGPSAALYDALAGGSRARALLSPDSVAAIRAPASGPAALWIHLWALTALLGIGIPRAALAALSLRRAHRLAAALAPPLSAPYYVRLLAADRGEGVRVRVWPYSHRPSPRAADRLRELLHEHFGNRAQVTLADPVEYGGELAALAPADAHVALFNLAQPPEQEVHGAFVEALRARGADHLRVLLDEEPYTARMGWGERERVEQRLRAWERMLRAAGAPAAVLPDSLDGESLDGALRALAGAEHGRA